MIRRLGAGLLMAGACMLAVALIVALAIHLTVQDSVPSSQAIFLATPRPVLTALAALLAGYCFYRRLRWVAGLFSLFTLTLFTLWLVQGWRWSRPPAGRGQLRVVQWNVDRPWRRLEGDLRWLAAQDADVITIAERQPRKRDTLAVWQTAFPGYRLVPSPGEMLCLVRGEVQSVEIKKLSTGSFATLLHTRVRDHDLTVLQVDIVALPAVSREPPLHALAELIAQHRSECLLVAGDFNTPLESTHIAQLRQVAHNAFETAGSGYAATWPMPLPVLSLDQMWTTDQLRAVRCEHQISWRSDHRAVVAEFNFAP